MFTYYLDLARRAARRSPGLTAWMVLTLALGIGACMTTLTVYHVLAADPIPAKSARLFNVQLDAGNEPGPIGEPNEQLTRRDAENLLREAKAARQVMTSAAVVMLQVGEDKPQRVPSRMASADFFALTEAPLAAGRAWTAADDAARARVVVLGHERAEKAFGTAAQAVGQTVRADGTPMQVIGVLAPWRPVPHYFDLTNGAFARPAEVLLPFSTAMELNVKRQGSTSCWGQSVVADHQSLDVPCDWIQYWVELPSAEDAPAFLAYLNAYSKRQGEAGRFEHAPNARLTSVPAWLTKKQVVPADVTLQLGLALGFLVVCIVCAVGLQLAKTLRRSREVGVRRALGATRQAIFAQFVVESLLLGAVGCVLGMLLAWGGLALVRRGGSDYARLAQMDGAMLAAAVAVSLVAALLAGVLPAWRASRVAPALQIKS